MGKVTVSESAFFLGFSNRSHQGEHPSTHALSRTAEPNQNPLWSGLLPTRYQIPRRNGAPALRRLSGHLRRSLSTASAETMLLSLRRLPGHLLRCSLSTTATSPLPWAMIYRFSQPANIKGAESFALPPPSDTTGAASFALALPPSATLYSLPELAFNLAERKPNPDLRYVNHHGAVICAASSDGLLLLKVSRHRVGAQASRELPIEELVKEVVEEEYVRFVCNPVTGQLFRLPDFLDGEKFFQPPTGLLTQADGGHGPPKRYAAVDLIHLPDEGRLLLCRFSSETGEWNTAGQPSPLPPGREMRMKQHEVLAFGGRLWWVDVSWGAVSVDPFTHDETELGHITLPRHSMIPHHSDTDVCELIKYRRMGVSNGWLRYVEVSEEAPFQIRYFTLDGKRGRWTLEHEVSLGIAAARERPLIAAIDPLNADLLYLNIGGVAVVCLDMRSKKVMARYSVSTCGIPQRYCDSNVFLPCVLPSFLGSTPIPFPGMKDAPKQKTLADVLVRSDRCQKK
ncbi:hypothetical protein ACQ4PT_016498 [Festuca glaucescens]